MNKINTQNLKGVTDYFGKEQLVRNKIINVNIFIIIKDILNFLRIIIAKIIAKPSDDILIYL